MIKTVLAILLGAALGGGLVFLVMSRGTKKIETVVQPTETPQARQMKKPETISIDSALKIDAKKTDVLYTESGFEPKAIRVKVGTVVTFINKTNQQMWVGSDPHPVHTDHPEFDQDRVGEKYSHEFDETGIYNYHNHENPFDKGVVFVE